MQPAEQLSLQESFRLKGSEAPGVLQSTSLTNHWEAAHLDLGTAVR